MELDGLVLYCIIFENWNFKEGKYEFIYFESHSLIFCAITRGEMFLFFISKKNVLAEPDYPKFHSLLVSHWKPEWFLFSPLFLTFLFWNNYKEIRFFFFFFLLHLFISSQSLVIAYLFPSVLPFLDNSRCVEIDFHISVFPFLPMHLPG